jgi:hypothetical protein
MRTLGQRNLTSAAPLLDPGTGVTVSLTSFGDRLNAVYYVIESIGRGWARPARLILWAAEEELARNPPDELRRQVDRGLEIRLTEDYGPHKKYFPYVQQYSAADQNLVTADDDTIYGRAWLRDLIRAHRAHPESVVCHRAHRVKYSADGAYAPYISWHLGGGSTQPSVDNFATGVSGVLYTPPMLQELRRLGDVFAQVCPRADDVWLYFALTTAGWKVAQVRCQSTVYPWLPGTQESGLAITNVTVGNDKQIRAAIEFFARATFHH